MAIGRIARSGDDVAGICDTAATEMHELAGFDRTMVYRFDHDWHGEVIAEQTTRPAEAVSGAPFPGVRHPGPGAGRFIPAPCCA